MRRRHLFSFGHALSVVAACSLTMITGACGKEKEKEYDQGAADASTEAAELSKAAQSTDPIETAIQDNGADAGLKPAPDLQAEVKKYAVLQGEWPETLPNVTIKARQQAVTEVLSKLFDQLKLGLVMNVPPEVNQAKISLWLVAKPGRDVLEAVLEQSSLEAELKNGIAFITRQNRASGHDELTGEDEDSLLDDSSNDKIVIEITPGTIHKWQEWRNHRRHKNDRMQMGKPMVVAAHEEVDDAVVIGGSLRIKGRVRGDAVAVGGSVVIEPGGVVKGDAAAIGGQVDVKPGGKLNGGKTTIGGLLDIHF